MAFKRSGKADTARGVGQAAPRQTAEAGNGEADEWQTEAEVVEAAVAAARLPKQKRQEATRAGRDHRGAPPGSDAATAKAGKRQREGMAPREVRGEAGAVDANSSDSEDYTALKRQAGLRGSMRGSGEDGDFEIVSGPPGGSLRGPGTSGIGKVIGPLVAVVCGILSLLSPLGLTLSLLLICQGPGKPRRNLGGRRGGKSGGPAEEAPDPMWLDRLAAWGSGR